jgi:signal transduction histidine kinase
VTVSVGERAEGTRKATSRLVLAVSDQGPGIEPTSRAKIFDAFFTTRSHGAGMGLAVVRRIIDDHASVGATIEVRGGPEVPQEGAQPGESKPNQGATFEVGLAQVPSPSSRTSRRDSAAATAEASRASDHPAPPRANASPRGFET